MYAKNARFALGTDITRNYISIVLINLATEIIESIRVEKPFENSPTYYQDLVRLINNLVTVSGVNPSDILGAGFSVPGVLAEDWQMIVYSHVLQGGSSPMFNHKPGAPLPGDAM
jgi:predicted NBD/HSP70 family sugar kinase